MPQIKNFLFSAALQVKLCIHFASTQKWPKVKKNSDLANTQITKFCVCVCFFLGKWASPLGCLKSVLSYFLKLRRFTHKLGQAWRINSEICIFEIFLDWPTMAWLTHSRHSSSKLGKVTKKNAFPSLAPMLKEVRYKWSHKYRTGKGTQHTDQEEGRKKLTLNHGEKKGGGTERYATLS